MLARHDARAAPSQFLALQVLADGDEFHLRRDDAAARVVHLRHVRAGLGAARLALQVEAQLGELRHRQALAAVAGRRAGERLGVAALFDPAARAAAAGRRGCRSSRVRIGVGAGGVVDEDRRILLGAEGRRRVGLRDLAHRHADVGPRALDIDLARIRQRLDRRVVDVRVAAKNWALAFMGAPRLAAGAGSGRDMSRFPAPALSVQVPRVSLTRPGRSWPGTPSVAGNVTPKRAVRGNPSAAVRPGAAGRRARLARSALPGRVECAPRGCSSMVEQKLPKLTTRVRFPSPAPALIRRLEIGCGQAATPRPGPLGAPLAWTNRRNHPVQGEPDDRTAFDAHPERAEGHDHA